MGWQKLHLDGLCSKARKCALGIDKLQELAAHPSGHGRHVCGEFTQRDALRTLIEINELELAI